MKTKEQIKERIQQIKNRETTIFEEKWYGAYLEALEWVTQE